MITIDSLSKTFASSHGSVKALDAVSTTVAPGELLVLLGPSGCGKTTLLRSVAGLESADVGTISLGANTVFDGRRTNLPPEQRSIGMVFQSYALWPHMTVRQNIEFPLKARKLATGIREGWALKAAEVVDCAHLMDRYPGQLSGGQQQRIALARGLVARPDVMLFDEPLSNLDALLRQRVRAELHELHQRLRITGIYVTHDQDEALALADRLAIMRDGRIEQIGDPRSVYDHPTTEHSAVFVGFSNRVDVVRDLDGLRLTDGTRIPVAGQPNIDIGQWRLRLRPTDLRLTTVSEPETGHLLLPAIFVDGVYAGTHEDVAVRVDGELLTLGTTLSPDDLPASGQEVSVTIPLSRCRWFPSLESAASDLAVEELVA